MTAIARACSVGVGTVGDYVLWARAAGLSWPLPTELDDAALEAKLFPPPAPSAPRAWFAVLRRCCTGFRRSTPLVNVAGALAFATVAAIAAWLPANRASNVDRVKILRAD